MDVTPQLLNDVEFREQWRGYEKDQVDDFLERLAVAVGHLQDRLRDATDRAARAERRLADTTADDDELRRTLVLAQRTADAAIEEARTEATRLLGEAEEQARAVTADADERAAATLADAEERATAREREAAATVEHELGALARQRDDLRSEIATLTGFVADQRVRLQRELREQLEWLEAPGRTVLPEPPPTTTPSIVAPVEPLDETEAEAQADEPGEVLLDEEPELEMVPAPAEPTGVFDALAEDEAFALDVRDNDGDVVLADEEQEEDDPFLAELRRAADDDEPLGPRDMFGEFGAELSGLNGSFTDRDANGARFRRRRRH